MDASNTYVYTDIYIVLCMVLAMFKFACIIGGTSYIVQLFSKR